MVGAVVAPSGGSVRRLQRVFALRLLRAVKTQDFFLFDRVDARLKALRVPENDVIRTVRLWKKILNYRESTPDAVATLDWDWAADPDADKFTVVANQHLLNSLLELRALRTIAQPSTAAQFADLALTVAELAQRARAEELRTAVETEALSALAGEAHRAGPGDLEAGRAPCDADLSRLKHEARRCGLSCPLPRLDSAHLEPQQGKAAAVATRVRVAVRKLGLRRAAGPGTHATRAEEREELPEVAGDSVAALPPVAAPPSVSALAQNRFAVPPRFASMRGRQWGVQTPVAGARDREQRAPRPLLAALDAD